MLPRSMRGRWLALTPLALVTAVLESVGAAAVFGLIQIVADPARARTLPVASRIVDWLPSDDAQAVVLGFTVLVGLFYLAKNALAGLSAYVRARCVEDSTAAVAVTLLCGYLRAPYVFHLRRNSAQLIHTGERTVHRVFKDVLSAALEVLTEGLVALGIVTVLFVAAPQVTLVAAAVLVVLGAAFLVTTRRLARRIGRQLEEVGERSLRHLQQGIGGVKELKVLGRESAYAGAIADDQRILARLRWVQATFAALPRLGVETVFVCGALLVIALVTFRGGGGTETVSILGLYAYAGFRVIPSVNRILWQLSLIRLGSAAVERVWRDFVVVRAAPPPAVVPAVAFRDRIALERVSFAYDDTARDALHDVSLTLGRGESLGVVGPTGCGKTTLVDVVVGLLEPSAGRVTVDGVDLRGRLAGWHGQIGYIPQSIFLVDDTLRRNVALGVPDADIDEARVRRAIRLAQLEPFVAELPRGLETYVGERGVRLSGGERQRVGIARALYHDPPLLVLDEATSQLDGKTEAELTRAIEALRGERTLLIIAHRLATVRRCDRLVLLREGRVVATGTFDELLASDADFRAMAAGVGAGEG
jgi:ATP-binding cassette subfamily C protein